MKRECLWGARLQRTLKTAVERNIEKMGHSNPAFIQTQGNIRRTWRVWWHITTILKTSSTPPTEGQSKEGSQSQNTLRPTRHNVLKAHG